MFDSYIKDGKIYGSVAKQLLKSKGDPGSLRPFVGDDGGSYITLCKGMKDGEPQYETVFQANAPGILLFDEWKAIDDAVLAAAQPELKAWAQLRSAATYNVPGGWGKTAVVSTRTGDMTPAEINMSPLAISDQDRPVGDMVGVPLPIIHKDWNLDARTLAVMREGNFAFDTALAEDAAVKVAQEIEKLTIGVGLGYQFAGYPLYGYTNSPERLTYELTDPTDVGWTPKTLLTEIMEMQKASRDAGYSGPWKLYLGADWAIPVDSDYSDTVPGPSLRDRVARLDGITSIDTLDYLSGYDIVLVMLVPRVARAVVAMDLTTLQWEEKGGLDIHFKTMAICVPEIRSDFYGGTGLVHGAVPAT